MFLGHNAARTETQSLKPAQTGKVTNPYAQSITAEGSKLQKPLREADHVFTATGLKTSLAGSLPCEAMHGRPRVYVRFRPPSEAKEAPLQQGRNLKIRSKPESCFNS